MEDTWPIGVFTSFDAGLGLSLPVARGLGLETIQLHAPTSGARSPEHIQKLQADLAESGIRVTCVFAGFEGESYADIPTVARTIGLVPAETRAQRSDELKQIADFAKGLGVNAVGLHIGCVPHDAADPEYAAVLAATRAVCDHCRSQGQAVHLETGQEPADVLHRFLTDSERDNLFVNFDPANMILYGCGEPLPALREVAPFVRSVHCKDAKWSDQPGETWGQETPLGEGDVGMREFLAVLKEIGYRGPLTIEREIPEDPERQKAEIGAAVELLQSLKAELLP